MVTDQGYKTLLVDASFLAYRVFFALPELSTGHVNTHLVYGFLTSLMATVKRFPVEELIVVWDSGHVNKSQLFTGYKKKDDVMSKEQREDFEAQFKLLDNFLLWLGVKCCYQEGFEADDVIAHLCNKKYVYVKGTNSKYRVRFPVIILSGDHDLYPLLSENVVMCKFHKETLYTAETFRKEFPGLEPWQYQEMQALMGCSGDKVEGVRGIGPKRAAELIRRYRSAQGVKDTQDSDYPPLTLVKNNWAAVELSQKLVAFEDVNPELLIVPPDLAKVRKHFFVLGMNSLIEDWVDVSVLSKL